MNMTLHDILKKEIFDSYTVLSGEKSLNNTVESVSVLETPDFGKYIVENSLILTTFYPLRDDVSRASELIKTLQSRKCSGLVVKVHRYIDEIPEDILGIAKEIDFPIISLDYDANLSTLFNNILSEIQARDYSTYSIDKSYSKLLKAVYHNPTTQILTEDVEKFEDFDLLIKDIETNTIHSSSSQIENYYNKSKHVMNTIQKIDSMIYYSEVIIYEDNPIYQMVFLLKKDRRHMLHNYIEIFKLLIIVIYQKKLENTLTQNEFLLNFVSNLSTSYTHKDIQQLSKRYNWDVHFPVILVIFSIKSKDENIINTSLPNYIQTLIINMFHVYNQEVKYTYLNERLLFIINASLNLNNYDIINHILNLLVKKYPNLRFKILLSNPIHEIHQISATYSLLSESISHIEKNNFNTSIYTESNIELLNLMKNIDFTTINHFLRKTLNPLIVYEKTNSLNLVDTLYSYFNCKFNARECAKELYIHYNSLRHRLSIIKDLGYDLSHSSGHFDLYFALYLYKNFLE